MSYPEAIVIVAVLFAGCFERYLRFKQFSFEDRLKIQDAAIKNIADQAVTKVKELEDKIGRVSLVAGMKAKDPK